MTAAQLAAAKPALSLAWLSAEIGKSPDYLRVMLARGADLPPEVEAEIDRALGAVGLRAARRRKGAEPLAPTRVSP